MDGLKTKWDPVPKSNLPENCLNLAFFYKKAFTFDVLPLIVLSYLELFAHDEDMTTMVFYG